MLPALFQFILEELEDRVVSYPFFQFFPVVDSNVGKYGPRQPFCLVRIFN